MNFPQEDTLKKFIKTQNFLKDGALFLDLDGTALREKSGIIEIPSSIREAMQIVHSLNRPVVLNTLRFPLSVIKTVGRNWHDINSVSIPAVLLNGSLIGYIHSTENNDLVYEEIAAYPLTEDEIDRVIEGIGKFAEAGLTDISVFYYPRDWKEGEIIWTSEPGRVEETRKRYLSASKVVSGSVSELRQSLKEQEVCMIFILINGEGDQLMAYQHTHKNNYYNHQGVDKAFGASKIAEYLGFSMEHSIGAGDTELDNFLNVVGLSIHVNHNLPYRGLHDTLRVDTPKQLGELIKVLGTIKQ